MTAIVLVGMACTTMILITKIVVDAASGKKASKLAERRVDELNNEYRQANRRLSNVEGLVQGIARDYENWKAGQ